MNRGKFVVSAAHLLLGTAGVQDALGHHTHVEQGKEHSAVRAIGSVVSVAAVDAAYRSFVGLAEVEDVRYPIAVGEMALVFDSAEKAQRTYQQVAQAAHLRTKLGECHVAVETVTAANGLVSYWGFLHLETSIVVLTLDTLDPHAVSMTNFRSLVSEVAALLEQSSQ